ncbi:hypothetical protein ACFLWZ_02125 [Chloroflexota bacterium]
MDRNRLIELLKEFLKVLGNANELDWFHQLGKAVDYMSVENIKLVRSEVDNAMGGLSVLYLFAMFEYYFDQSLWKTYLSSEDEKILRAYRHVRHSIAHGHHGLRVPARTRLNQEEYDAFDEAINNGLFSPRNIITLDNITNMIKIHPTIGVHLKQKMRDVALIAMANVARQTP